MPLGSRFPVEEVLRGRDDSILKEMCFMVTRVHVIMAVLFLAPIVTVLVMNKDAIVDDTTPRPDNGYLIYVTSDT